MLAWCEPYKYADGWELAAAERPLLACLDQVTDPRNLGAVIRSAEGAGATGVVVPAHGAATVTPAVARASAGAVEHLPVAVVPNLARYLSEVKRGDFWIYAATGDATTSMWDADLTGGARARLRRRGKGTAPARAQDVRRRDLDPARRQRRVAERQRRRCADALRGEAAAWLIRRSTSSTATTSSTPGTTTICDQLRDELASFVALKGARGYLVFDGSGADESYGPLEVRYAKNADTMLERLAAENRDTEVVCLVSSDVAVRGTSGQRGAEALVRDLPRRARRPSRTARTRRTICATRSTRDARKARANAPRRRLARTVASSTASPAPGSRPSKPASCSSSSAL